MHIGIDYTAAIHQTAGIGRYAREIVAALARAQTRHEYRLFVAAARGVAPVDLAPNFAWRPTWISERWLARLWYRLQMPLPVEAWTGRLDVFHQPDFFLPPTRARAIVTVHDLSFVREPDSVMTGMTRQLNQWVPRSVERAAHVVAVSEATKQDVVDIYGTSPAKIAVIYHGVRPEFTPVTEASRLQAVRQQYKLGDAPFILTVGTLQPRKNHLRLVQAFAAVESPYRLVLAGGRGWDADAVFAEVERRRLGARVHFPGFVAEADLPALYSAAELFVYPSLYEGFGLPLLEAMACGTPVIAANRAALPEVVGAAGMLVNPYEVDDLAAAITQLLADPTRRQHLAVAGQQRAAQFTWDKVATQLLNLYQEVGNR